MWNRTFSGALSQAFSASVIGIDPSLKQLKVASARRGKRVRVVFRQGDAESLFLRPKTDMLFLSRVLHRFSDSESAISNLGRNLGENGFVVLRSATKEDTNDNFLFDSFPEAKQIETGRMMSCEKTVQLFERCGFERHHKQVVEQSFSQNPSEYLKKYRKEVCQH